MALHRTALLALVLTSTSLLQANVAWRRIDSSPGGILPPPEAKVDPTASQALDVDKDGDTDFMVAGRGAPAVILWRHNAGSWTAESIEPDDLRIEAGGATADIDGDGDTDVVFGGDYKSGDIWWWENPHPAAGRWTRRVLKRDAIIQHHDQIFGDFDGDGKLELMAWNQRSRSLLRFQVPANPRTDALWPVDTIFATSDGIPPEGLAAADIDGDGVSDLVGGGYWFKHTKGGKFAANIIDPSMAYSRTAVGQIVPGGRPEIVFGPGDADGPVNWYQWDGKRWIVRTIEPFIIHGHSVELADLDGDGHLDLFLGEMGTWTSRVNNPTARALVYYGDGQGNFRKQIVNVGQGIHECRVADLNGDGRPDILGKPFRHNTPRVVVWLNEGVVPTPLPLDRWTRHLIDDVQPGKRLFVESIDIDGDGHRDLVSGGAWHRNPGRIEGKWEKRAIGDGFTNFATSFDFNHDGAIDLIGTTAAFHGNALIVAFNDGRGNFRLRKDLPAGSGDFLQGVTAARLINGGTSVVLSWHANPGGLQMLLAPNEAETAPWTLKEISPFTRNEQVSVADLDRDGSADLVLGDHWLRNTPNGWTVHPMGIVNDLSPKAEVDRNRVADINGDGWPDVVVGLELGTEIFWFEHPGKDVTGPWKRHLIGKVPGQGFSMDVGDFDDDGDIDVVVGEHRNPDKINRVLLFANTGGDTWKEHVIDQGGAKEIDHHDGTIVSDVDGDGDLDIMSIGFSNNKLWILENKAIDRKG